MSPPASADAWSRPSSTAPSLTYVATELRSGEDEAGAVLLDDQPIGRLSRRALVTTTADRSRSPSVAGSVWHAHAVGWLPDAARPWDTRVTRSAPTRRRAAEDLIRAYRNRR